MKEKTKQVINKGVAKVPMVMQLEAVECGAACLTMVLAYFGKWISLEEVRESCGVSRDGSSAKNILRAAKNYGLTAKGYRCEPEALEESGHFPCIIHWNMNHFVVLDGFKRGRAYINDPAMGTYSVDMDEFGDSFTGICIFLEPGDNFVPGGKEKSILQFVRKRLQGKKSALVFVGITAAVLSLIDLLTPAFSRAYIDYILPGKDPSWLLPFVTGLSVLCVLQIAVSWISAVDILRLSGTLDAEGNTAYMWKVLNLPMRFFSQRMAGDIRVRQDASAGIAATLIGTLAPLAVDAVMLVFYLAVMLKNSVILTLIGVFSVLVNAALSYVLSKRRLNYSRIQMRDAAKLSATTTSGLEMIETIKASGAEAGFFERWAGYQASFYEQNYRYLKHNMVLELIPGIISSFSDIAVIIIGISLVIAGKFTIGGVMAFQGFLASFMAPAQSLLSTSQMVIEMRTDMERIDDVMEYPSDLTFAQDRDLSEDGKTANKLSGHIELKDVTFGYSPLAEPLIKDFSMEIKPGMQVAFVGASGCGKSTIAKLLSGLYSPWSGEILFDGKPLCEISKSLFTGSLAVVDQDSVMFEDSVADNIKLWDSSIENFEMILAARDAHIHDEIMARPGGYKCKMTEGGSNFSGGQCQRIEISRALAQDPTILILDEATSALDAQTEFDVVNAVRDRGITCIVIAHRLSTIRDCDLIVVLDHGRVVGRGTHDELMKNNEVYRTLILSD